MAKNNKNDKLKADIEGLLKDFDHKIGVDPKATQSNIIDDQINEIQRQESMDFEDLNPKFKRQAVAAIDSLYKFYLEIDVIDKDSYLNKKREMHAVNLSGIYFQLKTMRTVLERMAEEITSGNMMPKLVEAYNTLNDKYSETMKNHANYMLFMEETARSSQGQDKQLPSGPIKEEGETKYYVSANQKDLIDDIKEVEVECGSVDDDLTDPDKKSELLEKSEIDESSVRDRNEDIDDYESLNDLI